MEKWFKRHLQALQMALRPQKDDIQRCRFKILLMSSSGCATARLYKSLIINGRILRMEFYINVTLIDLYEIQYTARGDVIL